jgi:hypothetical protein
VLNALLVMLHRTRLNPCYLWVEGGLGSLVNCPVLLSSCISGLRNAMGFSSDTMVRVQNSSHDYDRVASSESFRVKYSRISM